MKFVTMSAVAAGLLIGSPALTLAQTAGSSGPGPAAGETSDRTPGAKTETPLSQRDKTTPAPSGSTAAPPQPGTTSDRTPDANPDAGDTASEDSGTKGKTTTGEDVKTPSTY